MTTNWNNLRYAVLVYFLILLFSGCTSGENVNAPVDLPEVACQPADVNIDPPFTIGSTRTAVPPETFLADQIENYYGVQLVENSLTNSTAYCDLFEMADEETAVQMLARTCSVPQMQETEPPVVGQEVCALESTGFRMVNFRQGRVVVSILADLDGFGVDEWAVAVNGRLTTK